MNPPSGVAGKFADDVASGATNGAQQFGASIADGAGALGEAAVRTLQI